MQRRLSRYREDDTKWPQKNKDGRQELEIRLGSEHISFEACPPHHALPSHVLTFCRPPRLDRYKTCKTRQILKGSVCSTTLFRISRLLSFR